LPKWNGDSKANHRKDERIHRRGRRNINDFTSKSLIEKVNKTVKRKTVGDLFIEQIKELKNRESSRLCRASSSNLSLFIELQQTPGYLLF